MHRKSGGGLILIKTRTQFLETKGYKVISFWNNDIDNNIKSVFLEIDKYIKPPPKFLNSQSSLRNITLSWIIRGASGVTSNWHLTGLVSPSPYRKSAPPKRGECLANFL